MAGGREDSSAAASHPGGDDDRPWRHPSEVGLAARGRVDRRRSGYVAAGVLLGGLGVLFSGVLMGHLGRPGSEPLGPITAARPTEHAVATVTFDGGGDDAAMTLTGVVVDDDGHVVTRAAALGDAPDGSTVTVRCGDGPDTTATVVGTDPETGLTLLRAEDGEGIAPVLAHRLPRSSERVELVGATPTGTRRASAELAPRTAVLASFGLGDAQGPRLLLEPDPHGERIAGDAAVFDADGRLVGLALADPADASGGAGRGSASAPAEVLPVAVVMDAATRILDADRD
jgi:S1-C subfamily serine protease